MGEWCWVHHIFPPKWCSNCKFVCGARIKLGLHADWGWVPSHSVRGKVPRTKGRERTTEEDTPQERCRGVQSWPEWCSSEGDPGILPVATELRCNPWTEEGLMEAGCCGAGAAWCSPHLILLRTCDPSALHPRRSLNQEILVRSLP